MRAVGAEPPGQPAEEQRPAEGDELDEQDGRDQDGLVEAQRLLAVRRRGVDDGLDPVVVEEVGDQEGQRHRVGAQLPERGEQLAEAALQQVAGLGDDVDGRVVAQPDERDDREPRPPDPGAEQREAHRELLAEADGVVSEVHAQVDRQQQAAAEVAEGPPARRGRVALVLGGDVDQDRVVGRQRAAGEDAAHHHRERGQLPLVALHEEQQHAEEGAGEREAGHVPLLAAGAVDEGADDRAARTRSRWWRSWSGRTAATRRPGAGRARSPSCCRSRRR